MNIYSIVGVLNNDRFVKVYMASSDKKAEEYAFTDNPGLMIAGTFVGELSPVNKIKSAKQSRKEVTNV